MMSKVLTVGSGFTPEFRLTLTTLIKQYGLQRAYKWLRTEIGYEPAVAKALLRNSIRNHGW